MKTSICRTFKRSGAFSLIELLGILAIIAVLAAMLFPVFAQARRSGSASCLSNRKQLNQAFFVYAEDYDETTVQQPWQRLLAPYVRANGLRPCPNLGLFGPGKPLFLHIRGYAHPPTGDAGTPDMTWHNGEILPTTVTAAIFWGTNWSSASFDGDKISGMDTWYSGFGGSNYAGTSDEYTGSNGQVTSTVSYLGHVTDFSKAPTRSPSVSTIQNEVCRAIPPADLFSNGYYAVYVDAPRPHNANFCAWHSYGSCNGVSVQFAFFWHLDGDAGCSPEDTSGLHSEGLAALANVSGHELSEARTDPRNGGWYDSSGEENGDKCAWTFGVPLVTFTNGTQWKIQGEWSNAAYNTSTGYPNSLGQDGCLSGQ